MQQTKVVEHLVEQQDVVIMWCCFCVIGRVWQRDVFLVEDWYVSFGEWGPQRTVLGVWHDHVECRMCSWLSLAAASL